MQNTIEDQRPTPANRIADRCVFQKRESDRVPGARNVTRGCSRACAAFAAAVIVLGGCSVNDLVADAVTGGGSDVFSSDDDPRLVREALPFGLKFYESLLANSPDHQGLLLACARGFTAYAFIVQKSADKIDQQNLDEARAERLRASKLFLRGRDYALRGLEVSHAGFVEALRQNSEKALAGLVQKDAPFLYWGGAAWAGALSANKGSLDLMADLPLAGKMIARVLDLDETYEAGSAHEFFISYEAGRPGGSVRKARDHFRRAVEISKGSRAAPYLALAESVAIKEQNLREFRSLLEKVLEMDLDAAPQFRLANSIARERAEWLKSQIPQLFVAAEGPEPS